jgi:hypothetical protein
LQHKHADQISIQLDPIYHNGRIGRGIERLAAASAPRYYCHGTHEQTTKIDPENGRASQNKHMQQTGREMAP